MGIPEDIDLLERNLDRLKNEYEQFFMGVTKVPPHTIQTAVERLIRKYIGGGINNSALRFRYQNLVAKYTSFSELWKRRLRMKEEGIIIGGTAPRTGFDAVPPTQSMEKPVKKDKKTTSKKAIAKKPSSAKVFSATTSKPNQETKVIDSIYSEYVNAQKKAGAGKKINQENFRKLINKQVDAIKKTHKCSAVNFRVDIKDGEVKLKAKPVK